MNELRPFPLVYLATPYTRYRDGIEHAFRDAAALAARLLREGLKVYSPITHTHPIAVYGGLDPKDHAIWIPFDEAMMRAADALLVAQMRGWRESYGVTHEIGFFHDLQKPVFYLDTVLMRTQRTPFDFDIVTDSSEVARVPAPHDPESTEAASA